MAFRLFAVVLLVLVFQIVRVRKGQHGPLTPIHTAFVLIAGNVLVALMFRLIFRVTLTPEGMLVGFSKRPIEWTEISSVDHGRVALGRAGFYIRSPVRATAVVLDSVAHAPGFREALARWAPEGHPMRCMLSSSH